MYSSIEESDKTNTTLFIKNKIKTALQYESSISIESGGDKLVIDGITFNHIPNQLEIIEGSEIATYANIYKKDETTPIFTQTRPNWIEMNYMLEDRHGKRIISEKFVVNKNKYDEEYLSE